MNIKYLCLVAAEYYYCNIILSHTSKTFSICRYRLYLFHAKYSPNYRPSLTTKLMNMVWSEVKELLFLKYDVIFFC